MSGDKFDQLYNALKADGAVSGTRENFKNFVYAKGKQGYLNRKQLYEALHADGAVESATYEEFAKKLGLHSVTPAAQQPKPSNAPRKPMTVMEMQRRVAQEAAQKAKAKPKQAQGTPDYMKQWNLLTKPTSQMTPMERSQAEAARTRMQNATRQSFKQKMKQAASSPIMRSRADTQNPMRNANPQSYANLGLDMDETMVELSSPEAQRARAIQQHKDDAMAMAGGNVNDNSGVSSQIDSVVDASMKEASDAAKEQYAKNLDEMGTFASQYERDQAFKGAQDLEQKLRQETITKNLSLKLQEIYSDKKLQSQIVQSADKMNMGIEEYVDKFVTPQIMNRAQQVLGIKNLEEIMPGGTMGYIAKNLSNSILGTLVAPSVMSRSTRQRMQEGLAISEGLQEMPQVKGHKDNTYRAGAGARFLSTATNMAMDSAPLSVIGGGANLGVDLGKRILTTGLARVGLIKGGAKLTAQQLGFKIANMTMAQKIGSGLLEGSARGALNLGGYSGITAALGQASTGDDTSLAAIAQAGLEGAKHGAVTGSMFGATGAVMAPWIQKFGINGTETTKGQRWLHGAQKAGATALGLGVEAGTMMVADNVTGDKEISVGQWLEDVVMVGAFKAGEPSNYGKIGQALYGLTHNTNNTFRFGKDSDGNWRQVDIRLTDSEKNELMNSTSGKSLMDAFGKMDKSNLNSKDNIDKNITKLAYQEFMADPNVSQSTKEKVNAAMGLFNTTHKRSYRSVNDVQNKEVLEYAQDGTLLTRTSYKNADERRNILFRQKAYRDNEDLLSLVGYAKMKDSQYLDKDGKITDDAVAFLQAHGYDLSKEPTDSENAKIISNMQDENSELRYLWDENRSLTGVFASDSAKDAVEILKKDPMRRTDEEVQKLRQFKTELDAYCFPDGEAHPEQSQMQGRSIAEEEGLGSDTPNPAPVTTELRNLSAAEDALQELMDSNDVFKETYESMKKQGLTNPQIYDAMIQQNGLTEEQLEPFARYLNANARVQGMQQATQEAIEQRVESVAGDWGFHGTMDGQQADGSQMLYVKDNNGRTLIVGSGDVAYDPTTGRAKDGVGDMLVCLDTQTREPVYVKVEDTTLDQTQNVEDFKNEERQRLQMINSAPYNQAAQEQAMKDASKPQPKEEEVSQQQETIANDTQTEQPKPIGKSLFGNVYDAFRGKAKEAFNYLFTHKEGDLQGVYHRKDVGDIDLVWGDRTKNQGLDHIIDKHIEKNNDFDSLEEAAQVIDDVINNGEVNEKKSKWDKVVLEKDGYMVIISKNVRDKDGNVIDSNKNWVVTAFDSERGKGNKKRNPSDVTLVTPNTNEGSRAVAPDGSPFTGKDTNNSSNGNENNTSLTFEDGSPVPMVKDSKGRLTPDYGNMKPEQAAEILTKQFGESAEKVVGGQIKKAEKAVKDAEKMKVNYEGELNDILEQEELKRKTVSEAQKQLEHAQSIKKAMTVKKVAETVSKEEKPTEGANQAGSVASQKFQGAPRLVGNKRSRTLPNNEKIKGHYEIVPAESLTPSHDATNGYKKSDGFPVDAEGRTTNDRDYENDKAAQQSTDQIALRYNGQAIEQVPVVSDEGIVYDGNGRTMAGQKAAKEGTDDEYVSELLNNAENFGFTREQIEKSGIEHPRLVLVTDDRMPYTTETFAKFNRNEKKAQNNTEQAVAKSKTLSPEDVGAIVSEIEGNGSLEAFFNNPNAISSLWKTLQEKGIIGQNEVAGLQDMPGVPNAQGKEFVKNLVLGAMFKPETIRMMGIDNAVKTKVVKGIRAIMDNSKLGDYALSNELDGAIRLLYEARTNKMKVGDLLRSSDFVQGNARDRFSEISQALAQALEEKATVFRDLMSEYNNVVKNHNTGEGTLGFAETLDKEALVKEFLKTSETIKQNNIKLYGEEGRNSEQKDVDVPTGNEERPEEAGGRTGEEKPAESESQQRVDKVIKKLATEITKQTGVAVHTDEKESQKALEDAEATDSDVKYHKETDKEVLDELNSGKTVKVYRAMQVIDGKLYPPMAASVGGKLVEANELGTWIRADENPEMAIPDIDPKTGKQKVDPKTGELKWKFKLDKGGKDATGKKATPINAAYNPYWHMSRSPLNDQFKSAWIRPNVVVVECEVPESELTSGYKAERAKDLVGEVDWKSGSVSGEVFKQTGRARKVILSRWCKPVRVLSDAEVAQRAKEFVGDAKVEIPENVLTPKQRIAFEEAGFKIGAPEKGVKKSEQIADALKAGLQIDNTVREFRSKDGEVYGFVVGGEIHLDTKKMKPETPLHEYTHLWTSALQRVNSKEWENVKSLLDSVEGLKEEVQKLYPELKGDDLYDEMLATYSGREGAKKLEETAKNIAANEGKSLTDSVKAKSFLGKVKEALKKYWNGVADMLHINFTSAEDVADKVLADWANGVNPNEVKAEEKSEPITITTEHGGEKTFSSEQVDMAKKIISENPEKPITHLQRQMKIGYEAATALAKALGWQEKPTFMPKEQKPTNPIEKAAEDYKKEHPLTDEEVSNTAVFDDLPEDQKQYCIDAALDYLHGEDTSAIAEAYYRNIYEKRGKNIPQTDKKDTTSAEKDTTRTTPMEALKKAASEYSEPKTEAKIEPKKQTRKELEAERDAADNEFDAFMKELRKKRMGQANSGFIDQNLIEAAPKMFSLAAKCAYSRIKLGMYDAKEVVKDLQKRFKEAFDGFDKKDVELFYSQIMSQKWRDGDKRMSLTDWAEYYRKLSPEHQDKLVGDSKAAEERKQKENSFVSNLKMIMGSRKVNGIRELRQLAKELGLEGVKDTDLQELAETAVVSRARDIASSKAMSPERKFAEIRKLYENQPSLNQRDSDRVEKQQYSTPAPYAYLANMYVKGNGKEIESALEPSAGNGMLTIGLPMDKVHVNDIDEARLLNLHRQGFKNITSQDGTQPFADKDVDVVVTNPPFGTATPKEYDGYKISSLEGQMAINALESMKDDGRAAIIIGGKTEYAKNGSLNPKDKAFLGYLYSHYNVEDVINVDGSLYAKQGTTYPTRIILINGRRLDENSFPPVKDKARAEAVKDYDELYKRINDDILRGTRMDSSIGDRTGEAKSESDRQGSNDSDAKGVRHIGGRGSEPEPSDVHTGISGESSERVVDDAMGGERRTERGAEGDLFGGASRTDPAGSKSSQSEGREISANDVRVSEPGGAGRNDSKSSTDESANISRGRLAINQKKEVKRDLSSEKVTYSPKSGNPFTLQSVMPADQQEAVNKNLEKLGDADQFLVDELGYNDKDDLYSHLAAEQVDSVALALHQAKQGNAFIIGDMTGIGKGRQAASLIRYAHKNGQIPVYFTKTAGLLSDVYRDLVDIGSPDLRPFVFGSSKEAKITDSEGNVMFDLPKDKEVKRVLDYISKYGKLPKEYDYVLTTYSQVGNGMYEYDDNGNRKVKKSLKGKKPDSASTNGQKRRDAVERLMENGYLILDESHTAGGNSGQGNYFQHIIQKAKNVTFFSATFAKRPDNMPIYSLRTAMNQGGLKPSELIDAVKRGGATLQEIMSQTLTKCGQMIRRERDMTGVTIDWKAIEDPVVVQEQREQYDSIIGLFNDIIDFQRNYVSKYVDERNEELAAIQSSMGIKQGTAALGIKNQPFASKAFNTVQQVLLSLKAKTAAERAIDYLKQGVKPVIALNNTNESQTGEIAIGEEMDAPDLGTSLRKGLEGTLRYTKKDAKDKKESGFINLADLGEEAVSAYHDLEEKIAKTSTGLSLSPIDVIKNELQKAGYKVGELTGRSTEFVYNDNGTVSKVKREDTDKKKLAREFNDGEIDALILNKSAATGISLHASSKFKDQRKRVMIVAQQQLDVNDEVQMRGRIDRTGQVSRGAYEYVVSQIPAEQRLLMMFKAKLKSLDANTTASQKSKFNEMDVADITNKYGDKVVREYATEHLDMYAKMADPFGWEKDGVDLSTVDPQKLINSKGGRGGESEPGADASKFLARMALLKVAEQEKMLQEIGELYKNEINRLNEMGENDLEITELPLKAKTIGKEVWKEGSEPNGDNAFADNTYIEKVNMAILKKPMKGEEVKKAQEGLTGGRSWDEYKEEKKTALKEYFVKKFNDEKVRLDERAKKIAQKAADKYNKEAKKNQDKNQLTDEQIEKNTQFQYDNVYKEEKAKADTALKNIKTKYQAFDRVLETFNTNEAYVLPTDMNNPNEMSAFGNSYGRLIDIKITDNYSPTASTISFATLDGRRKITFPIHGLVGSGDKKVDVISTIYRLTKQAEAMDDNNYRVVNKSIDNWDRMISNESRKDGYIITGNLMQALIDTKAQGLGGQLVKYTTDNGEVKTGILMPDRFKPTDAATEKAISSKAEDFMSGKTTDIMSSDGDVRLISVSSWRGTTIELRVPKSKAKGGKYYLDEKLRSLADGNDFYTKGGSMVANLQPENVRSALDRLSALGVKVREERKEGTHFRTERENSSTGTIVSDHVSKILDKVGGNVNVVNSPEEVINPVVKERLDKGENVTGWYDEKTGEVHLYMPNIHDRYTAEKTIWHEVVGHKGMRGLFGDKFNDFLRSIYYDLDKPENAELKKLVDEERKYNPLNIYDSIEEGIARLAEDGKGEVGFWNTIKNKVTDLLHEIGYRIAPNTKDVKYLLWLSKNLQKNPNSVYWKLKANAVRERLNREKPSVTDSEGMFFGDGKTRDLENMPKKEYQEATDGQIHFRTTPSAATAIDRYHRALSAHGYMFTESYMDNMLALKNLMQAIRPDNKKIEDIKSSENPYILQNTLQGAMSNEADMFERNIMKPLSKAMAGVLDAFEGAKDEDKIKNFNLYMIKKHGLERNRVFYVRDHINKLNRKEETKQDATNLQNDWNTLKKDLGDQLRRNAIRLDEYYNKMDEWIRNNIDQKFNPGDNDYSGFHGIYEIDKADAYDDAAVIAEVMDSEANMESVKRGSVADFWNKVNTATQYSLDSDYKNGLVTKENHDNVSVMFDWYVPLRKFDETTAEEVYGYVTEKGDPSNFIGPALMKAKGRKSLSETNILAQIGAIGNLSISRGGKNAIKQTFARFVRNNGGQGLVTEVNTWVELDGYDANNKPIWKEALPQIPENATPDEVAKIVSDFESDMQAKKTKGEALNITNRGRIGFKFERAKDKSQHIVDVMIAGKKHSFVINGNPRAAQALNGLLENSKAKGVMKPLSAISRFMAQTCTSYNPEFVVRNIVRDAEFALANISAKEDTRYRRLFEKYYAGLIPAGGAKSLSINDFSGSAGVGLFAKYRNGTLDTSNKIERYFKEFMENGGETGWVQIKSMKDWEKEYKQDVATERSDVRKNGKMLHDFFFGNLERLNEVAENQARFAVFCASRDYGRTAVRSAYDAKEVSVNFNRHGSGDAINSFKNGELGTAKNIEKKTIGFTSSYLRHCSMFFNAGIQSTNLLLKNIKTNPKKTIGIMASAPFALGALAALLNNCLIASEDEKDRKGVKDPYGELPDYIRRNNLCIYKGKGEFVTIPLAIELRAFYGIGDLAAGYTFAPNVKGQKEPVADAVGCLSQLVPVMDYLGNSSAGKDPGTEFIKAASPSALSPLVEWGFNSDWKGSHIERRGDFYKNIPAWQRAYKGTPESLKSINKFVNAQSNDVAKGNEYMLGNKFLDAITNPSAINHFFGGFGGGATTFAERSLGLVSNKIKGHSVETKDIPFVRSFFYTPSEQSSMQRTKSKWYNYLDEMETTMENVKRLKSKNATPGEKLRNSADYYNFQNSDKSEKINVIESAKRQMKRWRDLLKKSDDEESIKFANQNIDLIMQNAVDELDKLN